MPSHLNTEMNSFRDSRANFDARSLERMDFYVLMLLLFGLFSCFRMVVVFLVIIYRFNLNFIQTRLSLEVLKLGLSNCSYQTGLWIMKNYKNNPN